MNDLEKYFRQNNGRLINKWIHYFDIYERHFSKYRNHDVTILEIGAFHGGSLQMWKNYFGEKAKIYAIDYDPRCKTLEEENISIYIGSQSDRKFLNYIKSEIPPIDILIDDGGHTMQQQIVTFEELFNHVKNDGVYLCEDLHTSYWLRWGGGYKRKGTFIEYTKNFIDYLHAWHSHQKNLKVNEFTKTVNSVHYYDSIIVIEKAIREKPHSEITGSPSFSQFEPEVSPSTNKYSYLIRKINILLRFFRLPSFIWK